MFCFVLFIINFLCAMFHFFLHSFYSIINFKLYLSAIVSLSLYQIFNSENIFSNKIKNFDLEINRGWFDGTGTGTGKTNRKKEQNTRKNKVCRKQKNPITKQQVKGKSLSKKNEGSSQLWPQAFYAILAWKTFIEFDKRQHE